MSAGRTSAGCASGAAQFEENNNPEGKVVHFLDHFGLLHAANDAAHEVDPRLLTADAHAAAFAGQIATP